MLTYRSLCFVGHKNYLFQKLLAEKLPYESFRFDFRGNGDSDGTTRFGNIDVGAHFLIALLYVRKFIHYFCRMMLRISKLLLAILKTKAIKSTPLSVILEV
jgi:hypothetical protein